MEEGFLKSDFPSCLFTKWTVSGLTMLDKNLKAMRSEICLQQPFLGRPMFGWKKRHLRLFRSQMSKVIAHSQCKQLGFTWVWESGKGSELCIFCEAIAYSCQEISKCWIPELMGESQTPGLHRALLAQCAVQMKPCVLCVVWTLAINPVGLGVEHWWTGIEKVLERTFRGVFGGFPEMGVTSF